MDAVLHGTCDGKLGMVGGTSYLLGEGWGGLAGCCSPNWGSREQSGMREHLTSFVNGSGPESFVIVCVHTGDLRDILEKTGRSITAL